MAGKHVSIAGKTCSSINNSRPITGMAHLTHHLTVEQFVEVVFSVQSARQDYITGANEKLSLKIQSCTPGRTQQQDILTD